MLLIALGWGAFGGSIAALVMIAAFESMGGQGIPWGRKRRLIEQGKLCECGHGSWEHHRDESRPCVWNECGCCEFTARPHAGAMPEARQLTPPETFKRLMAAQDTERRDGVDTYA